MLSTEKGTSQKKKGKAPAKKITTKASKKTKSVKEVETEEEEFTEPTGPEDEIFSSSKESDENPNDFLFNSSVFDNSENDPFEEADENEDDSEESDEDYDTVKPIELKEEIDVFDYAFAKAQEKGDLPKFKIYKNGEYLAQKIGQYSYDRLQKEFGGGHYKIYAFRNVNNKYIKGQSKLVAETQASQDAEENKTHQTQNIGQDPVQFVQALKSLFEDNKRTEVEAIKAQTEKSTTETSMIMTLINQQNQMMQQQMQMQIQMMQKQSQDSMKLFEVLMTNMNQISNKKSEALGPLELVKLIESSKSKGASEMKQMLEMARELSETMYGGGGSGDDEPKEKESLAETLIKTLPALLAGGMGAQQARPQIPQQTHSQQRPVVPAGASANPNLVTPSYAQPQNQIKQETKPEPQAANLTAQPARPVAELGKIEIIDDEDEGEEVDELELGSEELEAELHEGEEYEVVPDEGVPVENNEGVRIMSNVQDIIIGEIQSDLISAFVLNKDSQKTARLCVDKLKKAGWGADQILKAFPTEASIVTVAKNKGLPEATFGRLKEFYGHFSAILKTSSNGVTV